MFNQYCTSHYMKREIYFFQDGPKSENNGSEFFLRQNISEELNDIGDIEMEEDKECPVEIIDNYYFQFFMIPEITNRSHNLKRLSDKHILELELEIQDMVYKHMDKLIVTYQSNGIIEYLLVDYSDIELETPQSLYGIIIKTNDNKLRYFTLEKDDNYCFCEVGHGFHSLIRFHPKMDKQEFIDTALRNTIG